MLNRNEPPNMGRTEPYRHGTGMIHCFEMARGLHYLEPSRTDIILTYLVIYWIVLYYAKLFDWLDTGWFMGWEILIHLKSTSLVRYGMFSIKLYRFGIKMILVPDTMDFD